MVGSSARTVLYSILLIGVLILLAAAVIALLHVIATVVVALLTIAVVVFVAAVIWRIVTGGGTSNPPLRGLQRGDLTRAPVASVRKGRRYLASGQALRVCEQQLPAVPGDTPGAPRRAVRHFPQHISVQSAQQNHASAEGAGRLPPGPEQGRQA